jgi:hypothetical protein
MTKKSFVEKSLEEFASNPRSAVKGNKLPGVVTQTIAERPDVQAKLSTLLFSLNSASSGIKGLNKSKNFEIFGYRSYGEFIMKSREDIENFISGLSEADQGEFTNRGNTLVIAALPDTNKVEDVSEQVTSGASVAFNFEVAVKDQTKLNAAYILCMWGDSAVRSGRLKASAPEKSSSEITSELNKKAKNKLNALKNQRTKLMGEANKLSNQMSQIAQLNNIFGDDVTAGISAMDSASSEFFADLKAALKASSVKNKTIAKEYLENFKAKGKSKEGKALLGIINRTDPTLAELLLREQPTKSIDILNKRKSDLKKQITALRTKGVSLLTNVESAVDSKTRARAKWNLKQNNDKIASLRAKLGTYTDLTPQAISKKAELMKDLSTKIEANINKGLSITQALQASLSKVNATTAEKQVIAQQTLAKIQQGMPAQFAVQSAVQELPKRKPKSTSVQALIDSGVL